jgi:proteasome lid subunit RPN8/RPN11
VLHAIASHITDELPQEAVGLVWEAPGIGTGMIPLTNTSEDPEHSYAVSVADLITQFERATGADIIGALESGFMFTLWHSHPSGQVGPSRGDMQESGAYGGNLTRMVVAVGQDDDQGLRATLF